MTDLAVGPGMWWLHSLTEIGLLHAVVVRLVTVPKLVELLPLSCPGLRSVALQLITNFISLVPMFPVIKLNDSALVTLCITSWVVLNFVGFASIRLESKSRFVGPHIPTLVTAYGL